MRSTVIVERCSGEVGQQMRALRRLGAREVLESNFLVGRSIMLDVQCRSRNRSIS